MEIDSLTKEYIVFFSILPLLTFYILDSYIIDKKRDMAHRATERMKTTDSWDTRRCSDTIVQEVIVSDLMITLCIEEGANKKNNVNLSNLGGGGAISEIKIVIVQTIWI